jgi:CRP/FNR family transcriptional regulator, cyclic AMP receptor protein
MSDDLDFSKPAGSPKPAAAPAAPPAAIYVPAIAKGFFESVGKEEQVAAGHVFFSENQKSGLFSRDKMYFLVEGQVGLFVQGKPIGTIRAGQIFGEMAAMTESPRSATAAAHTPCKVLSLDDKGFNAALQKKPEFALMMLGMLIQRLRAMMARLSGIPNAAEAKESPRVFDKTLLASLARGLGDQAQQRYNKGQVIMVAGQTGALMYVVLEGKVAISIRGAVVQYVGPGAVFGEMALIDQSPRSANAAAEADCVLLGINRQVFLNLIKSDPTFGSSLLTAVAERVRNTATGTK